MKFLAFGILTILMVQVKLSYLKVQSKKLIGRELTWEDEPVELE